MLIKQSVLASHLQQKLAAAYLLFGQDPYLLNEAAEAIKLAWQKLHNNETEQTILPINSPSDWVLAKEEACSYSLFANAVLIDLRYEKKTLEAAGKAFFTDYLRNTNPSSLVLLRAPNLSFKQIQGLSKENNLHLVQAAPLSDLAIQLWIAEKLQKKGLKFDQEIPALIYQYTQGNMLASAQAIEKLLLLTEPDMVLEACFVRDQLVDQCDYQLFDLAEACLLQKAEKVILLLRHAYQTKAEPTLILWILTQEIRLLTQLITLTQHQSIPFNTACIQLKIWPQKTKLYQSVIKKISLNQLFELLQFCKKIDECIKSTQSNQIWQALEKVALSLCFT